MQFTELLESERYQALDDTGKQKARAGYLKKVVAARPDYQALSNDEKVIVADKILNYGVDDSVKPVQHGRTFTEKIAPLAHAGSALLFDIPKAVVAKSGEAMGLPKEVALKSVFPEQETLGGKSLRFGASVPAYLLGGGALKAAGAANTASKVANPVARAGLEGLAYTAPYAGSRAVYENPEAGARDLALGAGIGAGIGAAGVGVQKAQQGAKWASKQTMMEWLKPKEKFMRYGKAPESVVQTENIVANNADDLMKKLKGRADLIGDEIDTALDAYPAKIDVSGSVRVVRNKINELKRVSPRENASLISKLEDIEADLIGNIGKESKMSAKDAFALKNRIIKGNKVNPFSQNPEADKIVAEAKRDVYRAISNELKRNVPGTRKLFDRYGNLQSAIVSLDNRMLVSNRNMLSGMGQVLHGGMGGAVGAVLGGGSGAGLGAVAGMALSQYMKTAHGRTRVANALWKFSQLGVKPTAPKAAPIIEEVLNGDPALAKMFKGDKGKAEFAKVLEEMQALPAGARTQALPGNPVRPGLPNLPAEGVYNDIRGGQKPIRLGSMVPEEAPMLPPAGLNRLPFIPEATPVRMQPNKTIRGKGFTFNPKDAVTGKDVPSNQKAQRSTGRIIQELPPAEIEALEREAQSVLAEADSAQDRLRRLMKAREDLKSVMSKGEAARASGDLQDLAVRWATGKGGTSSDSVASEFFSEYPELLPKGMEDYKGEALHDVIKYFSTAQFKSDYGALMSKIKLAQDVSRQKGKTIGEKFFRYGEARKDLTKNDEVVESLQRSTKRQPSEEIRGEVKRSPHSIHNRPPQAGGSGDMGQNPSERASVSRKAGEAQGKGVPPPNDEPGKAAATSPRVKSDNSGNKVAGAAGIVAGGSLAASSAEAANHSIDHSFIDEREGYSAKPYVPKYKSGKVIDNSGVTIGSGVDLGQLSEQGLKALGVSQAIINKVKPALGVRGQKAVGLTGKVNLDSKEIKQLSDKVREANFRKYIAYYEKRTGKKFSALPKNAQTAIGSVVTQYGPSLESRAPKFNRAIVSGNIRAMENELRNFGDKYPSRRKLEANLLKAIS